MTLDEAVARLRLELGAVSSHWTVEAIDTGTGAWMVECGHPASPGFGIQVDPLIPPRSPT